MARSYAKLKGSIWRDGDWRSLTTDAQRLYLLLLSQPEISNCGVVPYVPTRWAPMASDTTLQDVLDTVTVLAQNGFIVLDEDNAEVLIRTFVKHDKIREQPKLVTAARRQFHDIQSPIIRSTLATEYPDLFGDETPAKKGSPENKESLSSREAEPFHPVNGKRQPSALTLNLQTAGPSPGTNGLPFEKQLHVARIMAHIGEHADAGTRHIIETYAERLPEASLAKALESSETNQPDDRAAYIVGALKDETGGTSSAPPLHPPALAPEAAA